MTKVKKAVFPVGGLGTRFLPATKAMPKEMLPIVDKPVIQYVFEEAREAGIEQFIFITGRNKNIINNHFDHSYELQKILSESEKAQELSETTEWVPEPGAIAFIRQQEPLGLGHAVWCARNFIGDEPFAVLLPDELMLSEPGCLKQMVQTYEETNASVIAVSEVPKENISRYGVIIPDGEMKNNRVKLKGMVEKPKPEVAPSNYAIIGRYILQKEIFSYLEKGEKGAGGEIQLTDAMAKMAAKQPYYATNYTGKRFDCGNKLGFLEANLAFALERSDLKDGVEKIIKKYA
jgi:UTP--glucose-1-phosphate uridylyltransferase